MLAAAGGFASVSGRPQDLAEEIVLGITVAQMLAISFSKGDAPVFPLLSRPAPHRFEVVIDAMVFEQPIALAGMASEERGLVVDNRTNVDPKVVRDLAAQGI